VKRKKFYVVYGRFPFECTELRHYGALEVTFATLRRLINCRIIIIIFCTISSKDPEG